jgi:hypothetical protein
MRRLSFSLSLCLLLLLNAAPAFAAGPVPAAPPATPPPAAKGQATKLEDGLIVPCLFTHLTLPTKA